MFKKSYFTGLVTIMCLICIVKVKNLKRIHQIDKVSQYCDKVKGLEGFISRGELNSIYKEQACLDQLLIITFSEQNIDVAIKVLRQEGL